MWRAMILALAAMALLAFQGQAVQEQQQRQTGGGGGSADAAHHGDAASAGHRVLTPDAIQWEDAKMLPKGAKMAVLEGDPKKEGFFSIRIKLPDGYRIPPHTHPCPERVTVLSGTFHLGAGERFDPAAGKALPAGSYTSMPPGMRHFAWAEGETVLQVSTIGPWGISYVNPADDPRERPTADAAASGGDASRAR